MPLHFDARFNRTESPHTVNITVFGNVSGQANQGPYPGPDSPAWRDPTNSFGKFVDLSTSNNKLSTLFSTFEVLSYVPYRAPPSQFCLSTVNKACPIGPAFGGNSSDPSSLPGFTIAHDFYSSYAFSTIVATVRVQSGDLGAPNLACVSAAVTPELGRELSGTLRYVPAAVLALVGLATVFAALFSPWGSTDPCRWTSNYGRDEDLLRLVTPGFADCLQYIQFAVLLGALSLAYPGFYQPVLSQASWSVLMFNQSLVSHGSGHVSSVDGLYFVNATYGLDSFSQYVGMSSDTDIWACMVIWLLVIALSLFSICQLIFFFRWGYRSLSKSQKQDLRSKNLPFTIGNIVRIVYNYMMLPIIAFSMFQFVIASESPAIVVIMAVVVVVTIIAGACWILRQIFTTSPRAQLFDDLPTLLLYGPLFNTYSDEAAPFALITLLLTLLRGIAIGAVQQSGIAQLVLLAIGEVVYLLTLHAFRPYSRATSMNAYHTVIAIIRLIIILLSITFVPSLGVTEGTRGWVAYAILILHAMILLFAFFLRDRKSVV